MESQNKAIVFASLAALFWSTVATAFKIALQSLNPFELLAYSSFFSFLSLSIYTLFRANPKSLLIQIKPLIKFGVIAGFLNPFVYYLILFLAYDALPASLALTLNYSWAIVLPMAATIFLKKPLSKLDVIGIVIGFIGVGIISGVISNTDLSNISSRGLILAVSSSLVWSAFWIISMQKKADPILKLLVASAFGTLFSFVFIFFYGFEFASINPKSILSCAYIGLFEMGITFVLWTKGLELAENPAKVSAVAFLSPALSVFWIAFTLGEEIKSTTMIGFAVLLIGAIFTKLTSIKKAI